MIEIRKDLKATRYNDYVDNSKHKYIELSIICGYVYEIGFSELGEALEEQFNDKRSGYPCAVVENENFTG